jgi:NADH-quinone oxidoreductase subunit J
MLEIILFTFFISLFVVTILQDSTFLMVFLLISVFLLAAALLIICGFEFLGYLLLIIYVGAVAVLFVFMVMLFDRSEYQIFFSGRFKEDKFIISVVAGIYTVAIVYSLLKSLNFFDSLFLNFFVQDGRSWGLPAFNSLYPVNLLQLTGNSDLMVIGLSLYTDYFFAFILASLGLLVAMIGAILITRNFYTRSYDKSIKKIAKPERQLSRFARQEVTRLKK